VNTYFPFSAQIYLLSLSPKPARSQHAKRKHQHKHAESHAQFVFVVVVVVNMEDAFARSIGEVNLLYYFPTLVFWIIDREVFERARGFFLCASSSSSSIL